MIPTNENRKEKYRGSSEIIQNLYSSPESGEILMQIFQKNALAEKDYKIYVLTVGDVILGFYPKSELASLLQKNIALPQGIADKIASDLEDFLAPIPEVTETMTDDPTTEKSAAESSPTIPVSISTTDQTNDIAVPRYAKPLTDLPRYNDNQQ